MAEVWVTNVIEEKESNCLLQYLPFYYYFPLNPIVNLELIFSITYFVYSRIQVLSKPQDHSFHQLGYLSVKDARKLSKNGMIILTYLNHFILSGVAEAIEWEGIGSTPQYNTTLDDLPEFAHHSHGCSAQLRNKVFVYKGKHTEAGGGGVDLLLEYDIPKNLWTALFEGNSLGIGDRDSTCFIHENRFFIVSGKNSASKSVHFYNLETGQLKQGADVPDFIESTSPVMYGHTVMLFSPPQQKVFRYSLKENK